MAAPATRDFDPGRISPGETIAGGAGIALFVFLFLHWFDGLSAWKAFDVIDFLLAAIAILAVGVAGAKAMGNETFGRNAGMILAVAGLVATSMILTFVLEGDGRKIGLWLAFVSAIAVAYGGWRAMHEEPGTVGPLAGASLGGAGSAASNPTAPTTPMPAAGAGVAGDGVTRPDAPAGGAAGVADGKSGPGAPHPGTSTGAPNAEDAEPASAGADPVPGKTGSQTPPGLAGEPPASAGTQPPGL
jgi:hypothetical protein